MRSGRDLLERVTQGPKMSAQAALRGGLVIVIAGLGMAGILLVAFALTATPAGAQVAAQQQYEPPPEPPPGPAPGRGGEEGAGDFDAALPGEEAGLPSGGEGVATGEAAGTLPFTGLALTPLILSLLALLLLGLLIRTYLAIRDRQAD